MQEKNVPGSRRTALGRQGSCPGRARPFIRFIRYAPTLNGDSASSFSRSVSGASARGTSSTSKRRRPSATHCLPCKQSIEVAVSALFFSWPFPKHITFMCNMYAFVCITTWYNSISRFVLSRSTTSRHGCCGIWGPGVRGAGVRGPGGRGAGVRGAGVRGAGVRGASSFFIFIVLKR